MVSVSVHGTASTRGSHEGGNVSSSGSAESLSSLVRSASSSFRGKRSSSGLSLSSLQAPPSPGATLKKVASHVWDTQEYPTNPESYELQEEVGKGASASVYKAWCIPLDTQCAIKLVQLEVNDAKQLDALAREAHTMRQQLHPNILPLFCSFVAGDQLWMVMPYVSGGSAYDIMKNESPEGFDEVTIATITKGVLKALEYLHRNGVIHRDLKAANILIGQNGHVILGDLGVTATMDRRHPGAAASESQRGPSTVAPGQAKRGTFNYLARNTFVGTPCWMAPEVMEEREEGYVESADIWSFGITVVELAHGSAPYANFNLDQILMKTLSDPAPTLEHKDRRRRFTEEIRHLVALCLNKDPNARPSAHDLLKHKFFKVAKDSAFLAEHLHIEGGAALAAGYSTKKSRLTRAKSSVVGIAQALSTNVKISLDDEFCNDVTEALNLLRRLTLPPNYQPPGAEPLDLVQVRTGKALAFVTLKRTGVGIAIFKGCGFLIARTTNARREGCWSAPTYFDMMIGGLREPYKNMAEVEMAFVVPTSAILDGFKQPEWRNDLQQEANGQGGADAPAAATKGWAKLRKHMASKQARPPPQLLYGHGLDFKKAEPTPFKFPIAGAVFTCDLALNAKLYGEGVYPHDIMDGTRTRVPQQFERLHKELEELLENAIAPMESPKDAEWFRTPYYFQ